MDRTRPEDYVMEIESIDEKERWGNMYNSGMLMWIISKLTGDALEEKLQIVNETKCKPPFPASEVSRIACVVNQAISQCKNKGRREIATKPNEAPD